MLEKTFDPLKVSGKWYEAWARCNLMKSQPDSDNHPFSITMPPPNVTGSLHMGHALTFTLQDVLVRFARMKGKDVLWQPGIDHAGIATQMVVERELSKEGLSRQQLGREKFLERVWAWKEQSGGQIVHQLKALGAVPHWERQMFTLDDGPSQAVRKVFVSLYKQGLLYKDKRLVNWDPKLLTALSDLEVENREMKGKMWRIRYPFSTGEGYIVVATTRPETLFGDVAVAVHPEDERYQGYGGKKLKLPLTNREIPLIYDDYSDPEKGTGAVKITPAHDFNDFEVGKRHYLTPLNIFNEKGFLTDAVPEEFQGLDRFVARKKVLEALEEAGLLEGEQDVVHMVPHGDRSGEIVEPRLTDQWYVNAEVLAAPALKAVEDGRIKFVPENWTATYYEWLNNIQPWCVSRQLWWGHRIPAWYGPDGKVFVAESLEDASAEATVHYGKEVSLVQDDDVLDTWFSSALWPFTTLGWPKNTKELAKYYPTSVLVTGFDIIFFWVARMIMMGLHFVGDVPFKTIYIHALVRDEKGQKMSKTKGNVIDPLEIMDAYGADALRFSLASLAGHGRDIKFSKTQVEGYRNFGTKIWNAARFCEMNECVYTPQLGTLHHPINKWIVTQLSETLTEAEHALEALKFNDAATALYRFLWGTYCDWYLEFSKSLFQQANYAQETRETALWVLMAALKGLHPFMPYLTEEIWSALGGKGLISEQEWPLVNAEVHSFPVSVIECITAIRSVRSQMNVPPSAKMVLYVSQGLEWLADYGDLVCRLGRLEKIEYSTPSFQGVAQIVLKDGVALLPLADFIDLEKEKQRLEKDYQKILKEIVSLESRLSNELFLQKAGEEVVRETQERLEIQKDLALTQEKALQNLT